MSKTKAKSWRKLNNVGLNGTAPMALEVLVYPFMRGELEVLRSLAPGVSFYHPDPPKSEAIASAISVADMFIGGRLRPAALENARKLRLWQVPWAGVDRLPLEQIKKRGIMLASASGCNAFPVAEQAMGLAIDLSRKITVQDAMMKQGKWFRDGFSELYGKTMCVVGYGEVGVEIARRAKGFGMKVIAVKRDVSEIPPDSPELDGLYPTSGLIDAIGGSDFVILALPLTKETEDIINENELRAMKRSAFLINVGRGKLVNEDALHKALTEGLIAGAGIDVWYVYPPNEGFPSRSELHLLPNVIATSHSAGLSPESWTRALEICAENARLLSKGLKPLNLVDLDRGY